MQLIWTHPRWKEGIPISKRQNSISAENLETLFLLATLKVPVRNPDEYDAEIELLEK